MTLWGTPNTGNLPDRVPQSTLGEYLGATAEQSFEDTPSLSAWRINELAHAGAGGENAIERVQRGEDPAAVLYGAQPTVPKLSMADAQAKVKEAGLEAHLHLPSEDEIAAPALDIMLRRAEERKKRQTVLDRGPGGIVPTVLSVGTSFLVQALDPLNVASAFIPVVGELRYAKALAGAGESLMARAVARAPLGAAEGAVGQAAIEPLVARAHLQEGQDYTAADFLRSIMFGAVLGTGLHVGAGGARDIYRSRKGLAQYPFGMGEPLEGLDARGPVAREIQSALADRTEPERAPGEAAAETTPVQTGEKYSETIPGQPAPTPLVAALDDLPHQAKEDALRMAIAAVTRGEPVRVGEALAIAAKSDPRIAESLDVFVRPAALSAAPRELPPLHDGARVVEHGDHGPVIDGYEGRWAEALDWLRRAQSGDLRGVLEHPQIKGRIDVVWGDESYGLAHILARHPEIAEDLPNILNAMRKVSENANRIILESDNARAVVSRAWANEPKTWLLTAFTRRDERGGPDGGPGFKPATDLRSPLSRYYGDEGAEPRRSLGAGSADVDSTASRAAAAGVSLDDWNSLMRHADDAGSLDASRAAERLPEPDSLSAAPSKRVAAAEQAAAEAEAEYRAAADFIPDDIKAKIDAELKLLDAEAADRAEVIQRGAACLAAAVG